MTTKTGTREWASSNVNCCTGCAHGCLYCYARDMALRFRRISHGREWTRERIDRKAVAKRYGRRRGVVMFPSAHDITPGNLAACRAVLGKLLAAGNRVIAVTKGHAAAVASLCRALRGYERRLLWRFSLTGVDRSLLHFWEPGAPEFAERVEAMTIAREAGFSISVAAEPLLERPAVLELVAVAWSLVREGPLRTWLADGSWRMNEEGLPPEPVDHQLAEQAGTIWIGAARQLRKRTAWRLPGDHPRIAELLAGQTPAAIWLLWRSLTCLAAGVGGPPPWAKALRWKDSYARVLRDEGVEIVDGKAVG